MKNEKKTKRAQHTPGPWKVWEGPRYVGGGADLCIGRGDTWLANMDHRVPRCSQIHEDGHFDNDQCDICTIDSGKITDEQRANALLIAAAPDLLSALKTARRMLLIHVRQDAPGLTRMFTQIGEAIDKAEGSGDAP
jgi:hypothetical protein